MTATRRFAWPEIFRPCAFLAVALIAWAGFDTEARAEAAPTPQQVDQGREVYEDNCETCHGRDMVSPGLVVFDLRKFPKNDAARFRGSVLDGKGTAPCPHSGAALATRTSICCGPMFAAGRSACLGKVGTGFPTRTCATAKGIPGSIFSHRENF